MTTPTQALDPMIIRNGESIGVTFDQYYDTEPADLWQAVTDPARLARWFAPIEGELVVGQEFAIRFDDGDIPGCVLVSCHEPDSFSFEWPMSSGPTLVTARIRADDAGSRLLLTHERLDPAAAAGYSAGWDAYLRYLDDFVSGREPHGWWDNFNAILAVYSARISVL
jgi:uncharacterized protein YndB with AHSA1/START domain